MKVLLTSVIVFSLLFIYTPAIAQEATSGAVTETTSAIPGVPGILSAVPGEAYGFVAAKNPKIASANYLDFLRAVCPPTVFAVPDDLDAWTSILESLDVDTRVGPIDRDGPSAVVLLDPQKFGDYWGAVLFSASDPQAILGTHKAKARDTDAGLPAGVVKVDSASFLGAKDGFIVFASAPEPVAAVINSETSFEIMPTAREAFDKGQIVFGADLQQAGPFLLQAINMAQAQMTAQMAQAPQMPQMAMAMDMFSLYFDAAQSLIQQADKLTLALDINAEQAVLTKRVLFKADSPIAACLNAHVGLPAPTYNALPGGPFLLTVAGSIAPGQLSNLTEVVLTELFELPSIKDKFSAEHATQMIADTKAGGALVSGMAVTVNLGNPMTGMINAVARYDVSDSAALKGHTAKMYQAEYMSAYTKAFAVPLKYVYTPAAENYSGVDIDTIKMEMTPPEAGADADPEAEQMQMMMAQQIPAMLSMMYGPDMTFRLAAPNEKQVLFVMGGSGRMERAINVAQGNGSVLADDPRIIEAATKLPANRFAEAHLDLTQVMPMIMMFSGMSAPASAQAADAPLVSFSTSAEENILRADMIVPTKVVKLLIETFTATRAGPPPGVEGDID